MIKSVKLNNPCSVETSEDGGGITFTHVIHDAGAEHACVPAKIDEFMCTDFFILSYFG